MHTNCNQPTPCSSPCNSCGNCMCTCVYEPVGCINIQGTDCSEYTDQDIPCLGVKKKDNLTKVLKNIMNYLTSIFSKVSSSSLSISRNGSCSDQLQIEIVPSSDPSNSLSYGTDGKPFVPRSDINIVGGSCFTWQKTVSGNMVTFVPIIDWVCISQQVCPLCDGDQPCSAPTGILILSSTQNSITISWNQVSGTSYDILLNGALYQANATSPIGISGLSANTTYSLTVRAKCSLGATADSTISATTLPVVSCSGPSGLTVNFS